MGKGGSTTSTTEVKESPGAARFTNAAADTYAPPGNGIKQFTPYDPSNAADLEAGSALTAGFNADQQRGFQGVRDNIGAWKPNLTTATTAAMGAATGAIGQKQGLGTGWSTGADGTANFMDYNAENIDKLQNPYNQQVIDNGMKQLEMGRQRAVIGDAEAADGAGAFGGSRDGVQRGVTNTGFGVQEGNFLGNQLQSGFNNATQRYDALRGQGEAALGANQNVDQATTSTRLSGASQLAGLGAQQQQLAGTDNTQMQQVGGMEQQQSQNIINAGAAEKEKRFYQDATTAAIGKGLMPAPSSTTTSTNSVGSGAIFGSLGGAAASALPMLFGLSDETSKTNIKKIDPNDSLDEIRNLAKSGSYSYEYKPEAQASMGAPSGKRTGFMAQDLEKATGKTAPKSGGYKGYDITEHLGRLTHAIAALDQKVSAAGKSSTKTTDYSDGVW